MTFITSMPGSLTEARSGVPLMAEPVWWDLRLPLNANLRTVQSCVDKYSRLLPSGCFIDEAAVLLPPKEFFLERIRLSLEAGGWREFNRATDLVFANPFGTRYGVRYTFFRHPDYAWRLEVMQMARPYDGNWGFSPLHQALWFPNGETPSWAEHSQFPLPHLSFKPVPSGEGGRKDGIRAMQYVRDQGAVIAQACQSSYGVFWYLLPTDAYRQLYVKPRVNLRDEGGVGGS
jgi:hypothetical protein